MNKNKVAFSWLKVAMQYLIAAEFLLDIICKNKNSHSYFGNPISDKLINKKLESNDGNLFYPLMFNFYHSLEIIYKGLTKLHKGGDIGKSHSLTQLYSQVKKLDISDDDLKLLGDYIENIDVKFPEFGAWLKINKLTIGKFYLFLRYPATDLKRNSIELYASKNTFWKGEKALPFYRNMLRDVQNLRKFIVKHYHESINVT